MKLKTILTLLAALGILTACNDDFFDQVPDDRITIEQVFQRTSYSEKYLATVYSYIRDESHRTDGVPWDPCSDDLDVTYDREDYNSFKINLGNWSASSNYYEYWSHYYRGIRSATYFIQHIGSTWPPGPPGAWEPDRPGPCSPAPPAPAPSGAGRLPRPGRCPPPSSPAG